MSANILFYSNRCDPSKSLITMLESEKLMKFFTLVCMDTEARKFPEIKTTPTLIIKGIFTPYVAGDAFVWFTKIKQWKTQMVMQRLAEGQKQYIQSNIGMKNDMNILGFNKTEMEGMSDIFAFITEDNIPHAHFDYKNIGQDNIFYVADESKKISEKSQVKLMQSLESERNKQDQAIKQQIENFKNTYTK